MSDTNSRPPPPDNIPVEKKAVWVAAHKSSKGKDIPGTWRVILRHTKKKRGPKPGRPRLTTPAHASHVASRLDVPLAYLTGLLAGDPVGVGMIGRCVAAIQDAQLFISRFTTVNPDEPADE